MDGDVWQVVLIVALAVNAVAGFVYRVYRLSKGGPMSDVIGQAVLGALLAAFATAIALDAGWARWAALAYGVVFGAIVMPIWVLAVLIPMRPGRIDYVFTGAYWALLALTVLAAILV
jgi:hypothetical protein